MSRLSEAEVAELLAALPDWSLEDTGAIVRDVEFTTFLEAIRFVNEIAMTAEEHDHHPDIDIRYRRVRLALMSHDVGALTNRDERMARLIDEEIRN